jgi:hypothetical protein
MLLNRRSDLKLSSTLPCRFLTIIIVLRSRSAIERIGIFRYFYLINHHGNIRKVR